MSNYLTRLVARTLTPVTLRPRTRLLFEDAAAVPPMPEETPVITRSRPSLVVPEVAATSAHREDVVERTPDFSPIDRPEARPAFEPPPRRTRVHEDEPRPTVSFELPRVTHDDAPPQTRTEMIRVESPSPRVAVSPPSMQTIVETHETVRSERETVTLHDERIVQTVDRVERVPVASPSPRKENPTVRNVTTRRVTTRAAAPQPAPQAQPVEPTIHVSIGRIEVRANTQAATPRRRENPPALTLDAYLERRNGKSGR
jgi:hypothetical protein